MSQSQHGERGSLWIHGAGGHGCVVMEAARAAGWRIAGFVDDRAKPGERRLGLDVVQNWDEAKRLAHDAKLTTIVAVGDNATRARLVDEAIRAGRALANVIHPNAWVSPTAKLAEGIYVGPFAAVNAAAELGRGVIVNSGAIVEHHNVIGDFAHIAPGATLGGTVRVGNRALVGLGAGVRPGLAIGESAIIAAGAVVVSDVPAGVTVMGVPARVR